MLLPRPQLTEFPDVTEADCTEFMEAIRAGRRGFDSTGAKNAARTLARMARLRRQILEQIGKRAQDDGPPQ